MANWHEVCRRPPHVAPGRLQARQTAFLRGEALAATSEAGSTSAEAAEARQRAEAHLLPYEVGGLAIPGPRLAGAREIDGRERAVVWGQVVGVPVPA